MSGFLPLHILTIILALFVTFGFCLQFKDTVEEIIAPQDGFLLQLERLKQTVTVELEELEDWRKRVELLENHLEDIRIDKTEALTRHKRGVRDPRFGMFVGKRGSPGLPGTPGIPGAIGRRGQKGHKGIAGPPGLRGPPGPFGPPGWHGPPGFLGTAGIKGEKGFAGFDGIPGIIGDVGLVGYNGDHGHVGPPGLVGHVGFIGMPGPPGLRGDPGVVGFIGPPGEQGFLGLPGPVGVYGEPGLMGELGFMGPPGETGPKGPKGERGMVGDNGSWGQVGKPGPVYDPYAGMYHPFPIVSKQQGAQGENCTDLDDDVSNCSSFEEAPAEALVFPSKGFPAFAHPPPGAHVMPAQPVMGKFQMPSMYGKHYTPTYGPSIGEMEDENDILTEQQYLDLLKAQNISLPDFFDSDENIENSLNGTKENSLNGTIANSLNGIIENSLNGTDSLDTQELKATDEYSDEMDYDSDEYVDTTDVPDGELYEDTTDDFTTEATTVTTETTQQETGSP